LRLLDYVGQDQGARCGRRLPPPGDEPLAKGEPTGDTQGDDTDARAHEGEHTLPAARGPLPAGTPDGTRGRRAVRVAGRAIRGGSVRDGTPWRGLGAPRVSRVVVRGCWRGHAAP